MKTVVKCGRRREGVRLLGHFGVSPRLTSLAGKAAWAIKRLGAGWRPPLQGATGEEEYGPASVSEDLGQGSGQGLVGCGLQSATARGPEAVFQEYGFEVPPNILIRVVSNGNRMIRLRCTRRGAPEWYVECTSSCYRQPETISQMQVWSMWRAGWTEGVTISLGAGR